MFDELGFEDNGTFMAVVEAMLEDAADMALEHQDDPEGFISSFVQNVRNGAYEFFEPLIGRGADADLIAQAAWPLALSIWNHTPLPGNGFRPRPVPMPERNDPCRCGSGRKFKQCCARQGDIIHFPIDQNMMTGYVLEALPASRLKEAWRHLPHMLIGHIAGEWARRDWDDARRALAMLEPIFKQPDNKLDRRDEAALDAMLDVCDALDKPRKKSTLLKRMSRHPDKALRAAALQRLCCMVSDQGDYDAAWDIFREAQRADPDNPGLSHLEVLLLLQQGKIEQMKQRGRYWIKRLKQLDAEGYSELIAMIEGLMHDPASGIGDIMDWQTPGVSRLMAWVDTRLGEAPRPQHKLEVAGDISWIRPKDRKAGTLLRQWEHVFPDAGFDEPYAWENAGAWLDFLDTHPQAAGHFSILDDLLLATGQVGAPSPWLAFSPLLELGLRLLRALLPEKPEAPVAWGALENRPALRLLATIIEQAQASGDMQKERELMEWMLRLNPNDNLGFRGPLATLYLRLHENEKAQDLCSRYPDDMEAEVLYGSALALFRLGDRQRANLALAAAIEALPKVAKALLKKSMKRPADAREDGFVLGGNDQAWLCRQATRDLWVESPGAMEWLKSALSRTRPTPPNDAQLDLPIK